MLRKCTETTCVLPPRVTTGKHTFVVRQNLCRALYSGRTTKDLFAVRFLLGARQRKNARHKSCLPCARKKTHGKGLVVVRFFNRARQSIFLPLPFFE
jgi:hypothetical protein